MSAEADAGAPVTTTSPAAGVPRPAAFGPLFRLFLSASVGRARLVALGALGVVAVVVGVAIASGGGDRPDRIDAWVRFAATFGLSLLAPVVALLLASATLGGPAEDGTLVYLWLRPVRRWRVALAAAVASLVVVAPLVIVPLTVGALLADTAGDVVAGTALAHGVAVVAYTGLFTWLGLRVRRALAWGLAYILIWEGFVAAAGAGASRLAVRAYTRSILSQLSDVEIRLSDTPVPVAVAVPLLVGVFAVWLTGRRLARTDVA
jgi:ABC-2 type transport system permease protein